MPSTTVPQIRDFVAKNAWATPLEIAKHFGEYDDSSTSVMIQGPLAGEYMYIIKGVSEGFYDTIQEFVRAKDVRVKEDRMAWAISHSEAWDNFKDESGKTVYFVPLVFKMEAPSRS